MGIFSLKCIYLCLPSCLGGVTKSLYVKSSDSRASDFHRILLRPKGGPSVHSSSLRAWLLSEVCRLGESGTPGCPLVPHLPSLRVLRALLRLSSVEKYSDSRVTWAGSLELTRWGWVTGTKLKMLLAIGCPSCPPCLLWSQENIELGYTRTVDADVQLVERSVMGNRADLFQQSEEVAGECERQLLAVGSCLEGQCCGMSANGIFHGRFATALAWFRSRAISNGAWHAVWLKGK